MNTRVRGQASVETIAVFSLLLLPMLVAFLYSYSLLSDGVRAYHLSTSLDTLANAAEHIGLQGPGARMRVRVHLPSGALATNSYIGSPEGSVGHHIHLNTTYGAAFRIVDANISGRWPTVPQGSIRSGLVFFDVVMNESGVVHILPVR